MRKRHVALLLGAIAVTVISHIENYMINPDETPSEKEEYDAIDYYMTEFSVSVINDTGAISHTMEGQYQAYWQERETSFIIAPRISSKDTSPESQGENTVVLTAQEASVDHMESMASLSGGVKADIASATQQTLKLETSELHYKMTDKHIFTDQTVTLNGPGIMLQGQGLDSRLNEATLRLNSHVKSSYIATP